MSNSADRIDSVAVILLCLVGIAFTFIIFVSGSPEYGVLSTLLQKLGFPLVLGCSFSALLIAALILRRMYRVASFRPHWLLVFGVVSAIPFMFFMAIFTARFVHGE